MELFNPAKRELSRIRTWLIKPHRVRSVFRRHDGSTYPNCCACNKPFGYYDLAFHCITSPIRIVGYASYAKICFDCGLAKLYAITPQPQLKELERLMLEYKEG